MAHRWSTICHWQTDWHWLWWATINMIKTYVMEMHTVCRHLKEYCTVNFTSHSGMSIFWNKSRVQSQKKKDPKRKNCHNLGTQTSHSWSDLHLLLSVLDNLFPWCPEQPHSSAGDCTLEQQAEASCGSIAFMSIFHILVWPGKQAFGTANKPDVLTSQWSKIYGECVTFVEQLNMQLSHSLML